MKAKKILLGKCDSAPAYPTAASSPLRLLVRISDPHKRSCPSSEFWRPSQFAVHLRMTSRPWIRPPAKILRSRLVLDALDETHSYKIPSPASLARLP